MSDSSANVDSIDAIKAFKIALIKFAETGMIALSAAEGEVHRTLLWLQLEQPAHWASQLRKRQEALVRANEAFRAKAMFRDASGRTPDTTQEEKAVQLCKRRIEEAEHKIAAVKKYRGKLEKEFQNYKGGVQRFSSAVQADVPRAADRLERIFAQLDSYVALAAPDTAVASAALSEASDSSSELREDQSSMARPADDAPAVPEVEAAKPQAAEEPREQPKP